MALLEEDAIQGSIAQDAPPSRKRFTRDEYHAMDRAGIFAPDEHTELIEGEVYIRMSPIGAAHVYCQGTLSKALTPHDSDDSFVLTGCPVVLSDLSEPEPDVVILTGTLANYDTVLPTMRDVLLVVEVSDSTIAFDRSTKSKVYARAGVPEYWIVDVNRRTVQVCREPNADGAYASIATVDETGSLTPQCKPAASISVASILPRKR